MKRDGGSASRTFYRFVLRGYPRAFRDRYGTEMQEAFIAGVRAQDGPRWIAVPRSWLAAVVDLVAFRLGVASGAGPLQRSAHRRAGRAGWLDGFAADVRFALRSLRLAPGFTLVAVVTLALGIGGNAAIFSIVDTVLLNPLPYPDADDLVAINTTLRDGEWWSGSPLEIREWRRRNQLFEQIAFGRTAAMSLVQADEPDQIVGVQASANLLATLGVEPVLGRDFVAADGTPGAPPVALLNHSAWRQRFGADVGVVGRQIKLDGVEVQIVGVLPEGARQDFFGAHELYVPLRFGEAEWSDPGKVYAAIGRLRPDVDLRAAQADMDRVVPAIERDNPDLASGWGIRLAPLHEQMTGPVRPLLLLLLAAVGCVLLVACTNTGNLMLARGIDRRQELAVRRALGAGRGRLRRQLLAEAALLATLGGTIGLLLAAWSTDALLTLSPERLPRQAEIGIDGGTLAFTALASMLAALLFGTLPAQRSSRIRSGSALSAAGGHATGSTGILRLRAVLVALQLSVVVVLLIGATLTLRSFVSLLGVDPGFVLDRRVAVRISLPSQLYPTPDDATRLFADLTERVAALAEVERAATVSNLPFASTAGFTGFHIVDGRPLPPAGEEPIGGVEAVSPGYFETMGVRLLRGRTVEARDDRSDAPPVVVINEALWKRFWPDGADPVGEFLMFAPSSAPAPFSVKREIVGVVSGLKYGLAADVRPRAYTPSAQLPFAANARHLVIATHHDRPQEVIPQVRALLRELDPDQPIAEGRTLSGWRTVSVGAERFQTLLLGLFGGVALVVGAVGVYGVVSYSVGQRRREVGIRLALGAGRDTILVWVLRGALVPVLAGIGLGLTTALALSRIIDGFLYGVRATDPLTFAVVPTLLLAVALAASLVPALRAKRVDPLDSLRCE